MSRSGFTSSTVRMTSSNWVTSPRTTGAPIGTPANVAAAGFRSMPTTVSPRATRRRMTRGPMKPGPPVARRDPAIVRLAAAEVRDVLGLRLLPSGGVHIDQVVGQRRVERAPVALLHRVEARIVSAEHLGLDPGRLRRRCRHQNLLAY